MARKAIGVRGFGALSPAFLAGNRGDVWDSGKMFFSGTFQVEYGGKVLTSATPYYWTVRVWDEKDRPSAWTAPARFTTGLIRPEQWKAHWIAAEADTPPQPQARENVGSWQKSMRTLPIFRREFATTKTVTQALVFISGLGQYELHINGKNVTDHVLTPGWINYRKPVF